LPVPTAKTSMPGEQINGKVKEVLHTVSALA
jgi:hypothetical protein